MSLVFEDDFDTLTDQWGQHPWFAGQEEPGSIVVQDSQLVLTYNSTHTLANTQITSLGTWSETYPHYPDAQHFQEGYFEMRCRYTDVPTVKAAFWLLCYEDANNYPNGVPCPQLRAEWDIMENLSGDQKKEARMAVHRNSLEGQCGEPFQMAYFRQYNEPTNTAVNLTDWHVWGGRWKDGSLTLYLDGLPILTGPIPDTFDQTFHVVMSIHARDDAPVVGQDYQMFVDWVRVWQ